VAMILFSPPGRGLARFQQPLLLQGR
jgi:hypothetical protein